LTLLAWVRMKFRFCHIRAPICANWPATIGFVFGRQPSWRIEALIREEREESRGFMRELVKEREEFARELTQERKEFARELTQEREEFANKLSEENRTFMREILLRNEKVYTAVIVEIQKMTAEIRDMRQQLQANTKAVLTVLDRLEGSGGAAA
jgi:signal transduction histidine kinase